MSSVLERVRTGDYLDGLDLPPLRWVVPGVLPEGMGLLTGAPKTGKSWMALGVALAVASGGDALGGVRVEALPVLVLALEDGEARLQGRARSLLDGAPIPARFHYLTTATAAEVAEVVPAWLDEHGAGGALVVLDTLGRVTPPTMPGESAYARDYRVAGALHALVRARPGVCLLVVHHVRKAQSADWLDDTSGTNGIAGAADFVVNLHRERNEARAVLRVTGRDVPEAEFAATVEAGRWLLDGGSLADAAAAAARSAAMREATAGLGDRATEVVAYVAQNGPVRAAAVAEALDLADARRYLSRLADAGRLERVGRGLYGGVPTVPSVPSEVSERDTRDGWDTVSEGVS